MTRSVVILGLLFLSTDFNAQNLVLGGTYINRSNGGLCSRNIKFVNDSLYLSNWGCESSGTTTIGLYELKGDTVLLKQFPFKLIEVIKIDSSKIRDRKEMVQVKVFNQNGINITKVVQFRSVHKDGRQFGLKYDSVLRSRSIRRNCDEETITCLTYNKANKDKLLLNCTKFNSFNIFLKLNDIIKTIDFKWHNVNRNTLNEKFIINDKKLVELPSPMNMYLEGRNPDYFLY